MTSTNITAIPVDSGRSQDHLGGPRRALDEYRRFRRVQDECNRFRRAPDGCSHPRRVQDGVPMIFAGPSTLSETPARPAAVVA